MAAGGPSFKKPPVVETVLSIQFDELRKFRTTHFGLYYATLKDRFPVVEDKPRLEPVIESFPLVPRMQTLHVAPDRGGPGRVWFRDAVEGSMLLQLQPDRFAFNWCRRQGEEYPRYASNQPRLFDEFGRFREFSARLDLGEVKPNLCEVTYVNHIRPLPNETVMACFAAVFAGVHWTSSDGWLRQPPDLVTLNRVFTIGHNTGRLYAEAGIANDKQVGDFIVLKITARVVHNDGEDLRSNLDLAHLWVVRGFASLTEERIRHERWEQEE